MIWTQVSGRTEGTEAERMKCGAHPLLSIEQKQQKNIHTFLIAFTAGPGLRGGLGN